MSPILPSIKVTHRPRYKDLYFCHPNAKGAPHHICSQAINLDKFNGTVIANHSTSASSPILSYLPKAKRESNPQPPGYYPRLHQCINGPIQSTSHQFLYLLSHNPNIRHHYMSCKVSFCFSTSVTVFVNPEIRSRPS